MAGYTAIADGETGASVRGKINTQFNELFGENAKSCIVVADATALAAIPAAYLTAGKLVLQYDTGVLYEYNGATFAAAALTLGVLGADYIDFNKSPTVTMQEARLAWDSDAGTLMLGMPGGNVTLQIGQEMHIKARNSEVTTITNGTVVYIYGATGSNLQVKRADANVEAEANATIAIATEDVGANQPGYFTTFGIVHDVNTLGLTEGATIYLSETSGQFTTTKPTAPAYIVRLGHVLVANASTGQLFVKIDNVPSVADLSGVNITSTADGNLLHYDGATGTWINRGPKFGAVGAGNYSEFEADGTFKMNGDATVWRDLITSASNLRPGASPPSFAVFSGNIYAFRFDDAFTHELHGSIEMQHDYKEGSNFDFHIHWAPSTTNTGNCRWGLEYSIANDGAAFPTPTTVYAVSAGAGVVNQHTRVSIATITGTGFTIGTVMAYRIFRDGTNGADTFTGNAFLISAGVHYECDTIGSRQQTTK